MSNSKKLLVLCGPSGSGKSTLEDNLIKEYPEIFYKWQQVSTRKMRKGESAGNPYIFVQRETYLQLVDKLVGRIANHNNVYSDFYGSIPDFKDGCISTVILAEDGISDLQNSIKDGTLQIDHCVILGLDIEYDKLEKDSLRENRDSDFFHKEREVLKHATILHKTSNGKYLDPAVVIESLKRLKLL